MNAESMIHNKTVRIKDPDILKVFFPQYRVRDILPVFDTDTKILYVGRNLPSLRDRLSKNYESYILVSSSGEVDLTTSGALLEFVMKKWDKKPTEKLQQFCESLDQEELFRYLKTTWVVGRFPVAVDKAESSIYDLFRAVPGPQNELLETLLKLTTDLPVNVVESSFLTMLSRVRELKDQEVSTQYKKLLMQVEMKIGKSISPAIRKYAVDTRTIPELALVNLMLTLRGRS